MKDEILNTEEAANSDLGAVIGRLVTVCDKCLQASCWQGKIMCEGAVNAGTVDKTVDELKQLALEHESYWEENVR